MTNAANTGMYDNAPAGSPRRRILARKAMLWTERKDWDSEWRDIALHQRPSLSQFHTSDTNKSQGARRRRNILDDTATWASRVLTAGMMSGITSPARPWFRLGLQDKDLMQAPAVRSWLHECTSILLAIFSASNTYRSLEACYTELGLFGTWAGFMLPDFDNVIHHYPLTIGQYALATNHKGEVDTLYREFKMTVSQLVEQFGKENCSKTVQGLYDKGTYDHWVDVIHAVEPRRDRDPGRNDALNMPWKSCYIEVGENDPGKFLQESGFRNFPVLAPRWSVTGSNIYGDSPGMEAQGAVRQLQQEQLRKGQAIDYQTMPPLQAPVKYKDQPNARLPGGIMYYDSVGPGDAIKPAWDVRLDLMALREDIQDVRERIRTAFYADLFLMIANDTRSGVTATEIAERHEEKLLMLGPVLERLHNELLRPMVENTFDRAAEVGILPPAPTELEGMEIEIEFISVLAQAQRAVAASGLDRLGMAVGQLAQIKPEVVDKLNADKAVDNYADMYGVDPEVVFSDEEVAAVRQQRAQQQQMQEQAAMAQGAAETAKSASEVDTQNIGDIMDMFSGYGNTGGAGGV